MTALLAYPFHITPGSRVATVEDGTTECRGQELQVLILTSLGERPLVPAYGVTDPSFSKGLSVEDVRAGVELFGPYKADGSVIAITGIRRGGVIRGKTEVEVGFDDE